jgi:serine/threonine-protein kinase
VFARIANILFLIGIFITAAGASAYLTLTFIIRSEDTVVVPDLVGKNSEYATQVLGDMELNVKISGTEHSSSIPKDHIIFQDPEPGEEIKKGREVALTISDGYGTVLTPNLKGMQVRQAHIILENNGLRPGFQSVTHSESVEKDKVIAQSPSPGALMSGGEAVHLLVSSGDRPNAYKMPDFKLLTLDEAISLIEAMNLTKGEIKSVFQIGAPRNVIVDQMPLAGHRLTEGSPVKLAVNRRPGEQDDFPEKKDVLFRYRVGNGFLERHIRVQIKTLGFSHDIFDDVVNPGQEIWLLVPKNDKVDVLVYEDDELTQVFAGADL